MITAIVLAAGTSSRYGAENKLLQPFDGGSVVRTVVQCMREGGLAHVIVVTGHQAAEIRAALAGTDVTFAHNARYQTGEQVSSVKAGLAAASTLAAAAALGATAALIMLGDMPLLPAAIVRRIIRAYALGCGGIIAPRYGAIRGHPVLIARRFWPQAHALPDGAPMRRLLEAHPGDVALLQVNTDSVLRDVDTPELYQEARRLSARA
jgi:molybdenum cofactor cytidylyltransferase